MSYKIERRRRIFTAESFDRLLPTPHIHSHVELIYLAKGESVAVLDNREHVLKAGDVFLAFPNQIHFYCDKEAVEGYLVIFTPELFKELKTVFQTKLPKNPIYHTGTSANDMNVNMQKICSKLESEETFDEVAAKGYLLTILGEVFSEMSFVENPGDQDTMKRILNYCIENYTKPITLDILSKELYLNKYYISHVFRERMNVSLKDFINNLRVEYSCGLLEERTSITDVAYSSGFSSVRTYNRAFLKHMSMTPREYIGQIKK